MSRPQRIRILDGALATELERRGCDLRDPLWSAKALIEAPDDVVAVHRAYLRAGADVITTATYQATFAGLAQRGYGPSEAEAILLEGVRLAEAAREAEGCSDVLVAGSVGCYGAFLADGSEYRGDYELSRDALVAFHRPRLAVLAGAVDIVACETIPCLLEAEALAVVLAEIATPAWVSFSCRDGSEVSHGEPLAACVTALSEVEQVVAIGVNCTAPGYVEDLVIVVKDHCDQEIIVYPNSGERYDGAWHGAGASPEQFGRLARRWRDAGASWIGGCCRTTPEHIAEIQRAVEPTHAP